MALGTIKKILQNPEQVGILVRVVLDGWNEKGITSITQLFLATLIVYKEAYFTRTYFIRSLFVPKIFSKTILTKYNFHSTIYYINVERRF